MSIFGRAIKGTVGVVADGLAFVITKGTNVYKKRYGENEWVQTVSEVGTSTVRVSESTVKTLADMVDGGIETGIGYLSDDEEKKDLGQTRMKTAGKEIVDGVKQGIVYTYEAGSQTTSSGVKAGKYFVQGNKEEARHEFAQTKGYAKNLAKVVAVGLLAFGPAELGDKDEKSDLICESEEESEE